MAPGAARIRWVRQRVEGCLARADSYIHFAQRSSEDLLAAAALDEAQAAIVDLMDEYDTGDTTTALFWISAAGLAISLLTLDVTNDLSLVGALVSALVCLWQGKRFGRDLVEEQHDLGILAAIQTRIDALEAELIRRGYRPPLIP